MDEVGVDVVGTVDASDWLQTDARWLICSEIIKYQLFTYELMQAS